MFRVKPVYYSIDYYMFRVKPVYYSLDYYMFRVKLEWILNDNFYVHLAILSTPNNAGGVHNNVATGRWIMPFLLAPVFIVFEIMAGDHC